MNERCHNKNSFAYSKYGAKGLIVCDEWKDFNKFYKWSQQSGYKNNLSIDRIDNSIGYFPHNCRWATAKEQSHNRTNGLNWESVKKIRELYIFYYYKDIYQ